MRGVLSKGFGVLVLWFLGTSLLFAQTPQTNDAQTDTLKQTEDAKKAKEIADLEPLPSEHRPKIQQKLQPESGVVTGDLIHLQIVADARREDDITIPEQNFGPFDVYKKDVKINLPKDPNRKSFVFSIDLLALEPGAHEIPEVALRVVTGDGIVGIIKTDAVKVRVASLLANEPDAKPKGPSKPVKVMQDDYTLLYALGAVVAMGLVVLLTLLLARWWRKREKKQPPPPPRPPWEIAIEQLQQLQRDKQRMIEENKGSEFVDRASDIVRMYLGGRFAGGYLAFTGLETTSSEMIQILRELRVEANLLQEITAFLFRCDLVKFAKVVPNHDEVDLIFAEAQEIVRISTPQEPLEDETPKPLNADKSSEGGTPE